MSRATLWRLDAATGIGFVLLVGVALFLPGAPPRTEDSVEHLTALLIERRDAFLVGGYVAGLGAMAYLWFIGAVGDYLQVRGRTALAVAAGAGGTFAMAAVLFGMMMFSGVAFVAARLGDPATVRAFVDGGNAIIELSKFGFAVFVLAVSRAGAGILPGWLVALGIASVLLMVLSAVALFVDHGPLQFGGAIDLGGAVPALAWTLALSIVLMRAAPPTTDAR